ncbi:MAG TPA: NTP transferase domain-containing protein [Pseudonocardiaceae bacterium]|jgi:molybdopterin-guanine dinucleotide biosynthesis protein A|nr:NTP transferase domain-containing protein [Pseudonocardiaceae bacterium]
MERDGGHTPLAAVVLAGGAGRRLGGVDKPGLVIDGSTLLEHALAGVAGADPMVVVGPARPTDRPVRWTVEQPPGGGPAAGLAAGLTALGADFPDHGQVVVIAADLVGLRPDTVTRLRAALDDPLAGAVLVDEHGHTQWLTGVWRVGALRAAMPADAAGLSLRRVLGGLTVARLAAWPGEVEDVDTPADLAHHRQRPNQGP